MSLDEIKTGAIFIKDDGFSGYTYGFLVEENGKYSFIMTSPSHLSIWYKNLKAIDMAKQLSAKGWGPYDLTIMERLYP